MSERQMEMGERHQVRQDVAACAVHKHHSPITIINEEHHVFPQYLQKRVWGETRDETLVVVCATGHNTIHQAFREYERTSDWPDWCVGKTRDVCEDGWARYQAAMQEVSG